MGYVFIRFMNSKYQVCQTGKGTDITILATFKTFYVAENYAECPIYRPLMNII